MNNIYETPNEFFIRLHHSRPRFKSNIEDVLIFMANEITLIGKLPYESFNEKLRTAIRLFPSNYDKKIKTIDNWRTEITSLLGLIEYPEKGYCKPSKLAKLLNEKQDLIEFFRFFCWKFQYPGGHLKPNKTLEMLKQGVRFKPAKYIIKLLLEGNTKLDNKFGVSKEEITHCMFNDLRVVRDQRNVSEILDLILLNRVNKKEYDGAGDVIRYAGDILDYMVLANLLVRKPNGKFYLKSHELEVLNTFIKDEKYFPSYESFYKKAISLDMVTEQQPKWFAYINEAIDKDVFQADLSQIFEDDTENLTRSDSVFIKELLDSIRTKQNDKTKVKTKEIGDIGEAITIKHEKARLNGLQRADLAKKVIKIPEIYAAGYDINSFEGNAEIKRLIEVKTTISKNKLNIKNFHMTPNEWGAAETFKDAYFIYRIMISSEDVSLFVLQNPISLYKQDKISMIPRHGVDISFNDESGYYEKLLT